MDWKSAIYLDKNEKFVDHWWGDFESQTVSEGREAGKYVFKRPGILALTTNGRLIFVQERGFLSKSYHLAFSIQCSQITAINMGGLLKKHVLLSCSNSREYVFHLQGIRDENSLELSFRRKIDQYKVASRVPYQEEITRDTPPVKEPQTIIQPPLSGPTTARNELSRFNDSSKKDSTRAQSVYGKMSRAEKLVANFLTEKDIWWKFHQPVSVHDEEGLARIYYPDFYLPKLSVYVEVCGADRTEYDRRRIVYEKNKIPIVFVQTYKEGDKWKNYLLIRLKEIHESRWNKVRDLP